MGCQQSNLRRMSIHTDQSNQTFQEFNLDFRQFIRNDRGQVFQFYHFSKIISRSSSSIVRKVVHRVSKIQRVCKIVPITRRKNLVLMQEVQFLKKLDHPNIVQVHQYFFDKSFLYIILEKIPGRTLTQQFSQNHLLGVSDIISILQQLLTAIKYCHSNGISHRLVQPSNVMIFQKQSASFIKLIDFSEAVVIGSPKIGKLNLSKQNQIFAPPQQNATQVQKKDIWSCGAILLQFLARQRNFENFLQNKQKIIKSTIKRLDLLEGSSKLLQNLLEHMLDINPITRYTAKQCIQHKIFEQYKSTQLQNKKQKSQQILNRLMKFKIEDNLKATFWMYSSLNVLTVNQKVQYMTEFSNLDKNKDGKLDFEQIQQGLKNTFDFDEKTSKQYTRKVFNSIDKNNNQYLQFSQFVMATSLISKKVSQKNLQKLFKQLDINQDGFIKEQQLSNLIQGIQNFHLFRGIGKQIDFGTFKNIMLDIFEKNS